MKHLLWLFLMLPLLAGSQNPFGATTGNTYAVIVGISDYQDEEISDLKYAHLDAEKFKAYLTSPEGGLVPENNIELLQNQEATQAQIMNALNQLAAKAQEGDQVFIYFSGHGDVETITTMNLGFLLTYDTPSQNYPAGALPIYYLEAIINTLSSKKARVVIVSDACRSGKLAGMAIKGPQVSAQVLQQKVSNEIKILACGPNQYSVEGEEWGGGVFSHYLLEGLQGFADTDEDYEINLFEIRRYLEDRVPKYTAPNKQFPRTVGDDYTTIAMVDPERLAVIKAQSSTNQPALAMVETKGAEEMILEEADTTIKILYQQFQKALAEKRLISPEGDCAYEYYQQLQGNPEVGVLDGLMRRNLAASLQENAQQAINAYLKTDPEEMERRWSENAKYSIYPEYLSKSLELLGKRHYMADNLKAKQLYFEAVDLRITGIREGKKENLGQALSKLEYAAELEPAGAFILNEQGLVLGALGKKEGELAAYQKAHELAPAWVMPVQNIADCYLHSDNFEKAEKWLDIAFTLKEDFAPNYNKKGVYFLKKGELSSAKDQFKKAIILDPQNFEAQLNLGISFYKGKNNKEAKRILKKLVEQFPEDPDAAYNLALVYRRLEEFDDAVIFGKKTLDFDPNHIYANYLIGRIYETQGNWEQAILAYEKNLSKNSAYLIPMIRIAQLYSEQGSEELALEWLEKALKAGYSNKERITNSASFSELKESEEFIGLMDQYFED
jgi:tetratricopeptide (TPR) repeat protein